MAVRGRDAGVAVFAAGFVAGSQGVKVGLFDGAAQRFALGGQFEALGSGRFCLEFHGVIVSRI